MINSPHNIGLKASKGAAVMITMFSLLLVSSLVVLSSAKSIKANTVVVRNQLFEDQAFESAEAGIEFGLVHLKENRSTIVADADSDGFIDSYTPSATTSVDNGNNTTYSIVYNNPTANNFDITQLSVTGTSDAGNVNKILTQLAIRIPFMENAPPAGFITYGGVNLSGNITIENTNTPTTIWSGGAVGLSGAANTNCGIGCGSDRNNTGTDMVENDAQLSGLSGDDFFENIMGMDKTTMQNSADINLTYGSNQNLSSVLDPDSNNGKAIWINQTGGTASFSGNSTIGSQAEPVILVINGDFKANGNTIVYGVIYVTQDWANSGGGTLTVHGAVIVEGDYSGSGTPNIIYDPLVLDNVTELTDFAKVAGSWRDF